MMPLFSDGSQKKGTAYFEFQYCRKNRTLKKLVRKGHTFWAPDSLLVHINNDKKFFSGYGKYLASPDGQAEFDPYGPNYYTKEHAEKILRAIEEEQPPDWEILAKWLGKAITEYNGFYFLGI